MNKLLKDEQSIIAWLEQYDIKNYTLIPDAQYGLVVDVAGAVNLKEKKLINIAVKFNIVEDNFNCDKNLLTSLKGAPASTGGYFSCSDNLLSSLEGCATVVGTDFYCYNNKIISLEYCPISVGRGFHCFNNQLTSLLYCPESVDGDFSCSSNKLESLRYSPKSVSGDFSCMGNELVNLEYLPTSVAGYFYCDGNTLLGDYQETNSFEKIKDKIASEKEKAILASWIETPTKPALHKI